MKEDILPVVDAECRIQSQGEPAPLPDEKKVELCHLSSHHQHSNNITNKTTVQTFGVSKIFFMFLTVMHTKVLFL